MSDASKTRAELEAEIFQLRATNRRLRMERDAAEEASLETGHYAAQYEDLFHHSLNGLLLVRAVEDDRGGVVDAMLIAVNEAFEQISGHPASALKKRRLTEVFDHIDLSPYLPAFARLIEDEEPVRLEAHVKEVDRHFEVGAFSPAPGFAAISVIDVGERVRHTEELEQLVDDRTTELSEVSTQLETVLAASPDLIFTVERDGTIRYINRAPPDRTVDDVIGLSVYDAMPLESHDRIRQALALVFERGGSVEYEAAGQEGRQWYSRVVPVDEVSGRKALIIATDVTEKHRRSEELAALNRELERSNRELADFAYVASHDLQEPLRTITGFIQLLQRRYAESFDERGDHYLELVVEGAAHMKALIDGLLEYSRIQTHGRPMETVDATDALRVALAATRAAFEESSMLVTWDDLPVVRADRTQLLQLLQNLLSNAIKFRRTDEPSVHVSARRDGDWWQFAVRDDGIGIEPQYVERIFKIFQRLHRRDQIPGTGIGLSVCARIVQRHGGRIWLESTPGEGSTFLFTLPAAD